MKYEYLVFNIVVLIGPVLALLIYPKIHRPKFKASISAILSIAAVFAIWDIFVTNLFWYFNPLYTLGLNMSSVPIEELFFFITVPFACLVLWINWRSLPLSNRMYEFAPCVLSFVAGGLTIVSLYYRWYYSASVCFALLLCVCLDFLLKLKVFQQSKFLIFLSFINILTFIFNLYLTARPIVTYNALMKSSLNIFTIPIEDFIYGMVLIALVIMLYEYYALKKSFR